MSEIIKLYRTSRQVPQERKSLGISRQGFIIYALTLITKEATKSVWDVKIEKGNVATDWSPALEDIEGQISTVESNFRQRADALDAGVSRLTEGLRTKADISVLNVTAENIRQSVKSLGNKHAEQARSEIESG